jgi:hypothetical protein
MDAPRLLGLFITPDPHAGNGGGRGRRLTSGDGGDRSAMLLLGSSYLGERG